MKVTVPDKIPVGTRIIFEICGDIETDKINWKEGSKDFENLSNKTIENITYSWHHFALVVKEGKKEYSIKWAPVFYADDRETITLNFPIREATNALIIPAGENGEPADTVFRPMYWLNNPGDTTSVTRQITINKAQVSQ